MDEETETPLDDAYATQEDAEDDVLVARSSIAGGQVTGTGG